MTDPARWSVVLVSPQTAGNVGAAARAMANFGFSRLRVVDARCDLGIDGPAGHLAVAYGKPVVERCREFATLDEALADVRYSIAMTMQESVDRPCEFSGFVPAPLLADVGPATECALVFGREDRGMTNEECSRCTARWSIPTSPEAPSLNLAQSVAIALAGIVQAGGGGESAAERDFATQGEVDALLRHVGQVLEAAEYERGVPLDQHMRLLRRTALRARLDRSEVHLFRGVCRRLLNAILGFERRP